LILRTIAKITNENNRYMTIKTPLNLRCFIDSLIYIFLIFSYLLLRINKKYKKVRTVIVRIVALNFIFKITGKLIFVPVKAISANPINVRKLKNRITANVQSDENTGIYPPFE
jgi:hypothetical protein